MESWSPKELVEDFAEDTEHRYALRRALLSSYDRSLHRQTSATFSVRLVQWLLGCTVLAVFTLLVTMPPRASQEIVVAPSSWPTGSFSPASPPSISVASSELFEI